MTACRSWSSSVICEYLDEKYPQNPLVPSDLVERARMRAWMHYIEEVAVGAIRVPSFNRAFLYRFEGPGSKAIRETRRSTLARCARNCFSAWAHRRVSRRRRSTNRSASSLKPAGAWTRRSAQKGPWLMGEQFTLADVLVMPSIDRMADLGAVARSGRANIRASAHGTASCRRARHSRRPIFRDRACRTFCRCGRSMRPVGN